MPAKRRTNWKRTKARKNTKGHSGFSDAEIEDSDESFSSVAKDFVSELGSAGTTKEKLQVQMKYLFEDFEALSRAIYDINPDVKNSADCFEKAKLALEIFSATFDGVDALHSAM